MVHANTNAIITFKDPIKQAHAHHRKEPAMTGAVSTTYILSFVAEDDEIVREMPFSCDEARSAYITRNDLDVLNVLDMEIEDYDPDTDVYTITTQDIVYVAC